MAPVCWICMSGGSRVNYNGDVRVSFQQCLMYSPVGGYFPCGKLNGHLPVYGWLHVASAFDEQTLYCLAGMMKHGTHSWLKC